MPMSKWNEKQVTSHSETSPIDLADPHPDLHPDLLPNLRPDLRDIICVIVFSPSCDLQPLAVTWRNIDARDPTRCLTTPLSLTDECSMKFCWLSLTVQMLVPKYLLLMKNLWWIKPSKLSFSSTKTTPRILFSSPLPPPPMEKYVTKIRTPPPPFSPPIE